MVCGRLLRRLMLWLRKRLKLLLILSLYLLIQGLLWLHPTQSIKQSILKVTYFTRPLWDKPGAPFQMIDHYYAPGMTLDDQCERHGWTVISNRTDKERPRVFDAVLFSIEIELLLIRIHELFDVVDTFLILESNSTFTGLAKPFKFKENEKLFEFARTKIHYQSLSIRPLLPGEDPFNLEADHRRAMNKLIKDSGGKDGDLIIMTDVDEIPSFHTINLIKSCSGVPFPLHLQLRNYLYSFEFFADFDSWRGKVVTLPYSYHHARVKDAPMLADSGWHCSFCFRYLTDFVFKMTAYSHADRVHSPSFLDLKRIQKVICEGSDIYDMLPEVFSFQDLIAKWRPLNKQHSGVDLPLYLIKNAEQFKFLLPGGCKREDAPS